MNRSRQQGSAGRALAERWETGQEFDRGTRLAARRGRRWGLFAPTEDEPARSAVAVTCGIALLVGTFVWVLSYVHDGMTAGVQRGGYVLLALVALNVPCWLTRRGDK
jgi:hypothetical protein